MTIRYATENDLSAIIELFRISLGEEGGIPEASFWKWKHELNPFGKSPTLLAFEGNTLIGLRTFLRWRFRYQEETIQAYRAVDTATHPGFRGKGIFRQLTLALIEDLKKGEPCLIFNTPNDQSRPGYLKMGWRIMGKTPLLVRPYPGQLVLNRFRNSQPDPATQPWPSNLEETWNSLQPKWGAIFRNTIVTDFSYAYLQWRYQKIPGFDYHVHVTGDATDPCIVIFRIKQSGKLRELRITDLFFMKTRTTMAKKAIAEIARTYKPDVITILEDHQGIISSILPIGFIKAHRYGLQLTYREVNSKPLSALAADAKRWYLNAGSVELL